MGTCSATGFWPPWPDYCARYRGIRTSRCVGGGEEFLLVLADCGQENALRIAENLRERIARSPLGPPEAMLVTVSVGVAEFDGAQTFDRTIACADEALYAAKKAGRNRICSAETTTT
ncbi:GGDEF domain-containing protein [Candidatus Accumulibacter contiguus]|uniref:GGDEF domain-containing protein n=1 Tax=Candidatus Accumulibacter contiguus TaxID=2954381 RepID=UPI00207BE627|nr:GGDEF domain-containing protein [Candidatus Accumulibacter contiguus]